MVGIKQICRSLCTRGGDASLHRMAPSRRDRRRLAKLKFEHSHISPDLPASVPIVNVPNGGVNREACPPIDALWGGSQPGKRVYQVVVGQPARGRTASDGGLREDSVLIALGLALVPVLKNNHTEAYQHQDDSQRQRPPKEG
jgi:hypothetical protein